MIHEIKISQGFADAVYDGDKTFEVRENDRGYNRGDIIEFKVHPIGRPDIFLREHPLNWRRYEITYVLSGWGIEPGNVVFGIRPIIEKAAGSHEWKKEDPSCTTR